MIDENGINRTTRDRLLRAWENSTELTRDFTAYSRAKADGDRVNRLFAELAEDEAVHAAKLLELLREFD